jgi:hypothetical protein
VLDFGERALQAPDADAEGSSAVHNFVAQAYAATGNAAQARAHFEQGRALARQTGNAALAAHFDAMLASPDPPG